MTGNSTSSLRAVIDIGSNTVRLVVFDGPQRAPGVVLNEKVNARLGKGVEENGLLSEKAMNAALAALRRFAALLDALGISKVQTVATAAVRDARNGADFLTVVEQLGLKPRLLSGEQEALTSATGVTGAFPDARGVVADLGGGSLELVHVGPQGCEHGCSLPLGTLRLPGLRSKGSAGFRKGVVRMVRAADPRCQPDEALYLVGGSLRALARYHMHTEGLPLDDPHGHEASATSVLAACRSIRQTRKLDTVAGISPTRLASLPDTAALLAVLIETIRPARVIFSSWGLREGLLFAVLNADQRQLDPLTTGVRAFAEPLNAPAAAATMVAGWTAGVAHLHDPLHENIRLAATMLALALQRVEPNLRGTTALDWALHKRWIGINPRGRAMMAACLLANAGRPIPAEVTGLTDRERLQMAQGWGLAIRLCRRLTGLAPQLFSESELRVEGGALVLTVGARAEALATETVEKDLKALADFLGLEWRVVRR